jgi:hypothetical protein
MKFFVSAISISFRKEEKKIKSKGVQQAAEAAAARETKKGPSSRETWPKRRPGPGFDSLAIPPARNSCYAHVA